MEGKQQRGKAREQDVAVVVTVWARGDRQHTLAWLVGDGENRTDSRNGSEVLHLLRAPLRHWILVL